MATYYDEHADLALVQAHLTVVLGEGPDALVHASALRDAGVIVGIGARREAPVRVSAEMVGIEVLDLDVAGRSADLLVLVDTDPAARTRFAELVRPSLAPAVAIVVTDPSVLRFGLVDLPEASDVVLVQPLAPAARVERELAAGRGVPVLVAVHQDVSEDALAIALSYAKALGGTRAGAIGTTVAAAAETSLFGAYGVAGAAVEGLVRAGFETLVDAGYPRDLAYLACVHGLQDAAARLGVDDATVGSVEEYARRAGGAELVDQHVRERLREALAAVRDGSLAAAYDADQRTGGEALGRLRTASDRHALTAVGRRVRRLLPWVSASAADARHAR